MKIPIYCLQLRGDQFSAHLKPLLGGRHIYTLTFRTFLSSNILSDIFILPLSCVSLDSFLSSVHNGKIHINSCGFSAAISLSSLVPCTACSTCSWELFQHTGAQLYRMVEQYYSLQHHGPTRDACNLTVWSKDIGIKVVSTNGYIDA